MVDHAREKGLGNVSHRNILLCGACPVFSLLYHKPFESLQLPPAWVCRSAQHRQRHQHRPRGDGSRGCSTLHGKRDVQCWRTL